MIPLPLAEVAAAAGGRLHDADPFASVETGVVVDSRTVRPGGVFAALRGAHVDGAEFAAAAVAAGAVAVLADRPLGVPTIVVPDVVPALGRLARHVLDRLPGTTVVGVTGSSGKTTTKDLLAQVLEAAGPTVAAAGSFNNEIGLPLTVLQATRSTRFLVLEYAARGVGHLAELVAVAAPDVAVVLNVGTAHLGEFGSREAVAEAKGELVAALPPDGLAVLNGSDPYVVAMAGRTAARVVHFGRDAGCQVRAEAVELDAAARPAFDLVAPQGRVRVALTGHGEHLVDDALAAAAVALDAGLPLGEVAERLSSAQARSRWRMEVTARPDGVTVVNDAYNANPESMRAAVRALTAMAGSARSWAVLGEMAELGPESGLLHRQLGELVGGSGVKRLVTVGRGAAAIGRGAALPGSQVEEHVHVEDVDAATALLRAQLRPGDVVLVKASRAVGLERVALALLDDGSAAR